ncbi:unnamed protein product [Angiostrongylus costaricensis]|uniref:SHSP domain-containing protein n=1 Tax=Angiostrongylus costaricensis TaxID=334426 RepID=A0A0R3PIS0_ANGCS|nr:unnamed protein product [Angiostrongylus costaricensis]
MSFFRTLSESNTTGDHMDMLQTFPDQSEDEWFRKGSLVIAQGASCQASEQVKTTITVHIEQSFQLAVQTVEEETAARIHVDVAFQRNKACGTSFDPYHLKQLCQSSKAEKQFRL